MVALFLCQTAVAATDVSFFMCYRPTHPEDPTTKALVAFEKKNPDVHPKQWGGLILPGGVVTDPAVREQVVAEISAFGQNELGLSLRGVVESPIKGRDKGNVEYLAWWAKASG